MLYAAAHTVPLPMKTTDNIERFRELGCEGILSELHANGLLTGGGQVGAQQTIAREALR